MMPAIATAPTTESGQQSVVDAAPALSYKANKRACTISVISLAIHRRLTSVVYIHTVSHRKLGR